MVSFRLVLFFGPYERSFLVDSERESRTFAWLAKVVFHRYTIFVPDMQKLPQFYLHLQAEPIKRTILSSPKTSSPPIEGKIEDHVNEGDTVICYLTKTKTDDIRLSFQLRHTGTAGKKSYFILSKEKQEAYCAEFKRNKYHLFQQENQEKLMTHVCKSLNSEMLNNGKESKDLRPCRPSEDALRERACLSKFRRRAQEKALLKSNNKDLYDYDPDDFIDDHESEDDSPAASRRRNEMVSSRQLSIRLRQNSGLLSPRNLEDRRKTEIRNTILELLRKKSKRSSVRSSTSIDDILDKRNQIVRQGEQSQYFVKPNGPMSTDVLWRQRVLNGISD